MGRESVVLVLVIVEYFELVELSANCHGNADPRKALAVKMARFGPAGLSVATEP